MPTIEDELSVIEVWIVETLNADPTVAQLVGGRIFDTPPPEGTQYPYIIYNMSSVNDVRGVGTQRIMSDTIYIVKAVASTEQTRRLAELAGAMDAALTLTQPAAVGLIGTVHSSVRERPVKFNEYTGGNRYSHRGGEYAIVAQRN